MTIADRLLEARGRDGVAGVRDEVAASVADAAAMFGLDYTDDAFVEVLPDEAQWLLAEVLSTCMIHGHALPAADRAAALAREFVGAFAGESPRFFSNGNRGQPGESRPLTASWTPAIDSDFDTGLLVLTDRRTACAWFGDSMG